MLEKNLNQLFSRLTFFWQKLNPKRLYDGTYVEGEPFDYIVLDKGKIYCFDAKECKTESLHASKIPIHQFNDMLKAEKNGATVFFLIYFYKSKKMRFIHPKTILDEGKATPESIQVDCELRNDIIKRLSK